MHDGFSLQRNPNRIEREMRKQQRRNVGNYLHSIAMDAAWLEQTCALYEEAGARWPVFGNRRNGVWYRPHFDGVCYFKSTDGHSGHWAFSPTRLNLHVAEAAAAHRLQEENTIHGAGTLGGKIILKL